MLTSILYKRLAGNEAGSSGNYIDIPVTGDPVGMHTDDVYLLAPLVIVQCNVAPVGT